MQTKIDPWKLSLALMKRSACRVQVGAVVTDREGRVFAWGWNHAGADGLGLCAERHALGRANPKRLAGAAIHIRGFNGRTKHNPSRARCARKHCRGLGSRSSTTGTHENNAGREPSRCSRPCNGQQKLARM